LDVILPPVQQGGAPDQQPAIAEDAIAAVFRKLEQRQSSLTVKTNGHANGAHANGS